MMMMMKMIFSNFYTVFCYFQYNAVSQAMKMPIER